MAFYLKFTPQSGSGTEYAYANTLSELETATTFRIEIDSFLWNRSGYAFSQAGASGTNRVVSWWATSPTDGIRSHVFGTATEIMTAAEADSAFLGDPGIVQGNIAYEVNLVTGEYQIELEGSVVKSGTQAVGTNPYWGGKFRFGARGDTDVVTDTGGAFIAGFDLNIGETRIFIDGTRVRRYSSDGTGSTYEEFDQSSPATLVNFPTDDSQWVEYTAPVTGPTITDIDGDESVYPGQSFVTTGTNFGATQGTGTVDIDGVAQTVTAWSDTSITCTAVRGGNEYGTGKTLTVTTDAATTATLAVAQEAEPGTFAVTAASPNTTDDASLWSGLVDTSTGDPVTVVDGDQAWAKDPNNLGNLSITPAGAISADTTGDFVVQFRKASEEVWGSDQTVSFELPGAASGAVPDVTIDAIPPVERLIAGEGKTDGRLVPKLSTTRLATSSIAFGKQNTAAPPFDAGLPYLTQPIRVQIADFFDTGAVTEIRMPSGTAIIGVHAIVLEAFDLAGAATMRMVTDQGTIVSGLDFSSTGWKLPTSYGDISAPTGPRARNVTLEPSDQTVTGSETTGDAYVFFSYIYR